MRVLVNDRQNNQFHVIEISCITWKNDIEKRTGHQLDFGYFELVDLKGDKAEIFPINKSQSEKILLAIMKNGYVDLSQFQYDAINK